MIGDLRVLVTSAGHDLMHMSAASVMGQFLGDWKVTVLTSDTSEVLAERVVSGHFPAERLRDEFIRVATVEGLDRTATARIRHLLQS